jgi:N-acetylmuramoyl-L-alanine amidase
MTRSPSDVYVSLQERVRIANQKKADFFLSLHVNAGGGTGFESYRDIHATGTIKIQQAIHDAVKVFISPIPDRGIKVASNPRLYVLRNTNMPAILLECMFIDNPSDALCLASKVYLGGLAKAITAGVVQALGIQKVKPRDESKPAWDPQEEINRLKERGIITDGKKTTALVSWAEFATVLNRILDREECKCSK